MNKDYILLNNKVNQKDKQGNYINLNLDKEAVKNYFLNNVNQNTVFFHSLEEKLDYLVENRYYDKKVLDKYTMEEIKEIYKIAYSKKIRFRSFLGAYLFYEKYAMRTVDNERILERYEDRLSIIALTIGKNFKEAKEFIEILSDRLLQGATPIFLNSGKLKAGDLVSCYLLSMEDNLESINYVINSSMQMSKKGGGVGINLTKLRARGETIKEIENRSSGVLPPSKVLEDVFSYINQLGARAGSGVVYLSIFHNDIVEFINSKKINADEKLRLKTLSTGVVIPDKFIEILKDSNQKYYYTFYPKNVFDITGVELDDMNMDEWYDKLVENKKIKKVQRNKLDIVQEMLRSMKESGYPYCMFVDNANKVHNNRGIGRINMSNLCNEIYQLNVPNKFDNNIYSGNNEYGYDISCVLSSLNLVNLFECGTDKKRKEVIKSSIKFLSNVSELSQLESVPSVQLANNDFRSIGLGVMGVHSLLVKLGIHYDSEEAKDLINLLFMYIRYYSLVASMELAKQKGKYKHFEKSDYSNGKALEKYINDEIDLIPTTEKVKEILNEIDIYLPTKKDWVELSKNIQKYGLYNAYQMAIAPNQSSAYIMEVSSSVHPVSNEVEIRDYSYLQAVYPMPYLTNENKHLYKSAYDIDPSKYLELISIMQKHVDQGISTTVFINSDTSLKEQLSIFLKAHKLGLKGLYYWRTKKQSIMSGKEPVCESCSV